MNHRHDDDDDDTKLLKPKGANIQENLQNKKGERERENSLSYFFSYRVWMALLLSSSTAAAVVVVTWGFLCVCVLCLNAPVGSHRLPSSSFLRINHDFNYTSVSEA